MPIKEIDRGLCYGCGICIESCPDDVLRLDREDKAYVAYPEDCCICYQCKMDCPVGAITVSGRIGPIKLAC